MTTAPFAVAVELKNQKLGRIRISPVSDASGECMGGFIQQSIEKGSHIITDGWTGYNGLCSLLLDIFMR